MTKLNQQQQGIALITVLMIAAVLMMFATFIINERQVSDRRTFNIINNARASEYMAGAEIFGTSLLSQFFEQSKAERVVRNQQWATTPMQFPIENNLGSLEGTVRDMHSCFNLNSLLVAANESGDRDGGADAELRDESRDAAVIDPVGFGKQLPGEKIYAKLLDSLLPSDAEATPAQLASTLRDWLDPDEEVSGADGAEDYTYTGYEIPYRAANNLLAHTSELLVIKGYTPEIYDAIKDYICVLPIQEGTINVNTVKPEHAVLVWALLDDVNLSTVQQVLQELPEEGYNEGDFFTALEGGKASKAASGRLAFDSKYFLMTARAVIHTGKAETKSLLIKNNNDFQVVARHIGD
ncbi:type II secretion system minor pseudopilin GspK [Kangiella sp. HZ709]|uniref:type II secretion system minor pseudopilin GspK n=1 Tax=Kangiella sp. HZ709 TaxID=2666328 RepID=UPI0012B0A197|nr:type II secretion system minor pseudopilin GspK [Kangiella sp. HZ709]MRX28223.1 general secretion pathway protein GspK [Kangiella sp. HZ709]